MPLVTRTAKGSPLTTAEMDGNLTFLKARSRPYANVAAMQADTDLQVGDLAQTVGYYSAGDGGGANYQIVSADTVIGYDEPNSQQYNWLTQQDFSASTWKKDGLTVTNNALLAPNGATSATFLRETNDNGTPTLRRVWMQHYTGFNSTDASVTPGPRSYFVYAAKYDPLNPNNSRRYGSLSFLLSNSSAWSVASVRGAVVVDLQTGTVTQSLFGSNFTRTSISVTEVSGYWHIQVFVTPTVVGQGFVAFAPSDTPTPTWSTSQLYVYSANYAGDGASGVYLWKWGIRPVAEPGIVLGNGLQAKPLFGNVARLSQLGAASGSDNNALLKALRYFGTNPGTLIVDTPTVFAQPSSLPVLTIPSNVDLKFEGPGALAGVTNMTVNSQLFADNRAVLPKTTAVTFSRRQSSVKSNWFGL